MKKLFLLLGFLLFLCSLDTAVAQDQVRNVSVELFGVHNTIGVNYDARFKGNSGWGYRVGIGYGYADNSVLLDQEIKGIGIPFELNYLLGEKRNKLELGFGASLGLYHAKEETWYYYQPDYPEMEGQSELYTSSSNRYGYFLFGNIGYRYQHERGFLFRIGITPSFNFGDKYGLKRAAFYPYLGIGKSF